MNTIVLYRHNAKLQLQCVIAPAVGTIDYSVNYSNYREIPTMVAQGYTHINDKNTSGNISDALVHDVVINDMLNMQIKITDIFISNNDNVAHEIKLLLYHVVPTTVTIWNGILEPGDTLTLEGVWNNQGEFKVTSGAVGPVGPAGPVGPIGPIGPAGPQGNMATILPETLNFGTEDVYIEKTVLYPAILSTNQIIIQCRNEEAVVQDLAFGVLSITNGVSFKIYGRAPEGATGIFNINILIF